MKFDFDVLAAVSPAPRGEFLYIGIVLWRNGAPEIYADVSPQRLSALDPNFPRLPVFKSLMTNDLNTEVSRLIQPLAHDIDATKMLFDSLISPMKRMGNGELFCEESELQANIESTLDRLVRRKRVSVYQERTRRTSSRLESQMKAWLRVSKIMGRSMEDLSRNRVVSQFPVSVEADVYADFAYRNGALHVIETLDLRGVEHLSSAIRNTAAFKSITLDMARDVVGEHGKRIGIVAASDYASIKPALRIFERNSDEIFAMDSPNDSQRFADLLAHGLKIDGGLLPVELSPG